MMNRISRRLGIKGLKGRIILIYIVFSFILAIVTFSPMLLIGKQQRLADAESEMQRIIHLQKTIIDNWLDEHIIQLETIADIPMMSTDNKEFMNSVITEISDNHPDFHTIAYANAQGIVEVATSGILRMDISDRDYFLEAKKGNPYISDVFFGEISKERIVTFSAPVLDDDHQFKGVLVGSVKLETVSNVMSSFLDDSAVTFLTDRNGKLITNSRQASFGSTTDSEIFQYAKEGRNFDQFYEADDGEVVLGDYVWLHNDRWLIIGETNKTEIFAPFHGIMKIFISGYTGLIVIGFFMIFMLFKQIKTPVERVLEGTRKIGEGIWKYRIKEVEDDAKEFSELSNNFNIMADLIEGHVISIAQSEEKFRTIAEYSSDMISIHESDGRYMYVSPAGKEILQYEDEEILGTTGMHLVHEDDLSYIREQYDILSAKGYVVMTYRIRKKNGEYVWFESSLKKLGSRTQEGSQIYVISRNITERKNAEEQLKEANRILKNMSARDGLTGVFNRRTFDADFKAKWYEAIQEQTYIALLMVDVDDFKKYNDTFGHLAGDDCLIKLANTLEHATKHITGKTYRYGGEEFVILLEGMNKEETYQFAEQTRKLITSLKITHENINEISTITVSIGINISVPTIDENHMLFLNDADDALYIAKKHGRNQVVIFENMKEQSI